MSTNLAIELTEAERKVLAQLITNVPVQGTLATLPATLRVLADLLKKLEVEEILDSTPPPETKLEMLKKRVRGKS